MLNKIKKLLNTDWSRSDTSRAPLTANEACALLLVEVARADFKSDAVERNEIKRLLSSHLELSHQALDDLLVYSEQKGKDSISVHPYTSVINEHYDYNKRVELIGLMWKVAFADGVLDKYEDSVIRKVADLLYVSHSDFVKAKLAQ